MNIKIKRVFIMKINDTFAGFLSLPRKKTTLDAVCLALTPHTLINDEKSILNFTV